MRALLVLALLAGCNPARARLDELACAMRGGEVLYDEDWGRDCTRKERLHGTCPLVELYECRRGAELLGRWSLPLR